MTQTVEVRRKVKQTVKAVKALANMLELRRKLSAQTQAKGVRAHE